MRKDELLGKMPFFARQSRLHKAYTADSFYVSFSFFLYHLSIKETLSLVFKEGRTNFGALCTALSYKEPQMQMPQNKLSFFRTQKHCVCSRSMQTVPLQTNLI